MTRTLWLSGLRYHLRHRWQLLLALVGIALGVAVVVAVDVANDSARRAFALSVEQVAGRATHQITGGPLGFDERLYTRLRTAGVRKAAPVVEGYAQAADRTFRLLGLDPFAEAPFRPHVAVGGDSEIDLTALLAEPGTVVLGAETAQSLGLAQGDRWRLMVAGRPVAVTVAGVVRAESRTDRQALSGLLLADIATAQELLGMVGRLSGIDLIADAPETVSRVRALLPEVVRLQPAEARTEVMAQMTRAFSLNLTALSLLALLVGLFLIYNTMTFSVVQRRPLLGNLRALGTSRREVFVLITSEALALGAVGTLLGIGGGIALAGGLVELVTRTINDLYFVMNISVLHVSPTALVKAVLLGIGATLAAALAPALEATRTPPRLVATRSREEFRSRRAAPRFAIIGLLAVAAAVGLLALSSSSLAIGFVALFLLLMGFALTVPYLTARGVAGLERLAGYRAGLSVRLALRGVSASLSRTAVAIAALAVAVSVSVGMGVMVDSFRQTVHHWLGYTLQADVYVSPAATVSDRHSTPLRPEVIEAAVEAPGVTTFSSYRAVEVDSPQGPVRLQALQLPPESRDGYRFREREEASVWPAFDTGAVLISEPFAHRHRLGPGDRLTLQTDRGRHAFPVAGVFYDYESDRGIVEMARPVYARWYDDSAVTGLGLYLAPGVSPDELIRTLRPQLAPLQALNLRSNRELRELSLVIFDRTFTITDVLRLLALAVAFVGVFSALMALQLERAREFAILRATGMTPGELWRLVTLQTGLMGGIAGVLALPLGLALAFVLLEVINRRAFGWTLWLQVSPAALFEGLLLALAAALLAGLYPARRMAASPPAAVLRDE